MKISIREFEETIYHENWPESELHQNEYDELIGINYGDKEAKSNVKKALKNKIDYQRIESNRCNNIFNSNLNNELTWKIETYEYGTRYGISASVQPNANFTFLQPIETSIHESSKYHFKKVIYDTLEKTLNSQISKVNDLQKLLSNFKLKGSLIFCYIHDIDEFTEYSNDDNSEFKFQMNEIHGKIKKREFMNNLNL